MISSFRVMETRPDPKLCKDYLNMPEKVFRAGKWVSIEEVNNSRRINKRRK